MIDTFSVFEAYRHPPEGEIVYAPNEEGQITEYFVQRLQTTDDDLVPKLWIPLDDAHAACRARLTFQGTVSLSGWQRNLTGQNGAGINEFRSSRNMMLRQVEEIFGSMEKPVELSVIGHSLGGADAQNMMVALMEARQQHRLPGIQKLAVYTYNSAGVPESVRLKSLRAAEGLSSMGVSIEAHVSLIGGDPVQQTGDATILVGMPPQHGKFRLCKTHCGGEILDRRDACHVLRTALPAVMNIEHVHAGKFFTSLEEGGNAHEVTHREYYTNETAAGMAMIREKCQQHKLSQTQYFPYKIAQIIKGELGKWRHVDRSEIAFGEAQSDRVVDLVMDSRKLRKGFYSLAKKLPFTAPTQWDERGNTVLHLLARDTSVRAVNQCIDILFSKTLHNTSAEILLNQKNAEGKTPIDYMLEFGNVALVDRILAKHAQAERKPPRRGLKRGLEVIRHTLGFQNSKRLSSETVQRLTCARTQCAALSMST